MRKVTNLVKDTFKENGLLAQSVSNYQPRKQQIKLAYKIKKSIREKDGLLAEAPTGVGKSLAALVPAFEHIMKTDEPVIVVTSSIILQEQYIQKDIPMLEKLYNFPVNAVLIKGRNNYLCTKKANDAQQGNVGATTSEEVKQIDELMKWSVLTDSGDKSELDFVPARSTWAKFSCVESRECTGKQCPFYNICPYYKERSKVTTSKLVVCNYHYFFTALDSEANMLPNTAKVIIMDEGHEINGIARDFQEKKYSIYTLKQHFDYFAKQLEKAKLTELGDTVVDLMNDMELDLVNGTAIDLFVGLNHEYKSTRHFYNFLRLEKPERTRMQKYAREHIKALDRAAGIAETYLSKMGFSFEALKSLSEYFSDEAIDWMVVVYNTAEYLLENASLLEYIFAFDESVKDDDHIFWLQPLSDSVSVHSKPLNGSGLTHKLFHESTETIPIVMSATLAANQSFEHVKKELGLGRQNEGYRVKDIIVSTPFNLSENLLWYLPENTPAGNDKRHIDFVLPQMKKIINVMEGRTLCLFTSYKNLRVAESYFRSQLSSDIHIVSQEQLPKQKIIDFAKENDNTVILGTKSFFTGIDIQGHHLSAILIDKLPFPLMNDPINDYLSELPRGFHLHSLPEAILSMKQAFGRLNRTMEDKGIVAVYDGRLSVAGYKNKIFNSFDFKINATKSFEVVQEYIDNLNLPKGENADEFTTTGQ